MAQKHFVTRHRNTLLQGTETLVTGNRSSSLQGTKTLVIGHRSTSLQGTKHLLQGTEALVTGHRITLLQGTETLVTGHKSTLLQATETLCYSAEKHVHARRKRSEKRKHIHREDGVLIRRTVERMYVPGDWIVPAPCAKISVTVKHHPLSNPACCKIVYLRTRGFA
jgi:hypothetical protein